jgi:8-oxo-dGTP diphosphatase
VAPGKIGALNSFFQQDLLPVQKKHGARLVGRWQTEDGSHVVAIWAYQDRSEYERIAASVRSDPDMIEAQRLRRTDLDPLVEAAQEQLVVSTVELAETELRHLSRGST